MLRLAKYSVREDMKPLIMDALGTHKRIHVFKS